MFFLKLINYLKMKLIIYMLRIEIQLNYINFKKRFIKNNHIIKLEKYYQIKKVLVIGLYLSMNKVMDLSSISIFYASVKIYSQLTSILV